MERLWSGNRIPAHTLGLAGILENPINLTSRSIVCRIFADIIESLIQNPLDRLDERDIRLIVRGAFPGELTRTVACSFP